MYKIKTTEIEGSIAVLIPKEVSDNYGISPGDEIDLSEADGAMILRSLQEAEKSREIANATEKVFDRWNNVFVELAKGAGEK
jgi:bifunctional DNA-binding transcriptional regulator/antitoxin component of YhaV-PrlF toxin-antitoxin module